ASAGNSAMIPLRVDQLGAPLDDLRGIPALDRLDEGAVDETELQVGAAVPHRKRRSLDEVRQRAERALRLAEPERKVGPLLFAGAGVEEPQEHNPRRLARCRSAANIKDA